MSSDYIECARLEYIGTPQQVTYSIGSSIIKGSNVRLMH